MSYWVEFTHRAEKELKRLDRTTARRIAERVEELTRDPFDRRLSRQMETDPESRYSRVGDWRIIYQVEEAGQVINVTAIRPRSGAYR